jgi:hypothetical protein
MGACCAASTAAITEAPAVKQVTSHPSKVPERQDTLMTVTMIRNQGELFGVDMGNMIGKKNGLVIVNIWQDGIVRKWNQGNPDCSFKAGHIIRQVNGLRDFWEMAEELQRSNRLELVVQRNPPRDGWQQEVERLNRSFNAQEPASSLCLHFGSGEDMTVTKLSGLRAGECGATECCICLREMEEGDSVVQLPCGHTFHPLCAGRWLTQSTHRSCPLCKRPAVAA